MQEDTGSVRGSADVVEWARRRCTRHPNGVSPPHKMQTDDRALCGARRMRKTEYWEEMPEPTDDELCYNCWKLMEAMT